MEDLGWYLVVQGAGSYRKGLPAWLLPSLLFLILAVLYVRAMLGGTSSRSHSLVKTPLPEDPLTGLPNRNYLNESFGELGVFNTTRYKSLAMFDIDRFKSINETMDGDEIILRIVELSKKLVDDRGIIFRWSGDEFVFFLEMDADEAEGKFKSLCADIYNELDVTISVGLVEVDLFESIKRNYHRAVQRCYAVKEAGGNGVCRKL
jgi:diguanylate cyclase (GGDEF)-like protein